MLQVIACGQERIERTLMYEVLSRNTHGNAAVEQPAADFSRENMIKIVRIVPVQEKSEEKSYRTDANMYLAKLAFTYGEIPTFMLSVRPPRLTELT